MKIPIKEGLREVTYIFEDEVNKEKIDDLLSTHEPHWEFLRQGLLISIAKETETSKSFEEIGCIMGPIIQRLSSEHRREILENLHSLYVYTLIEDNNPNSKLLREKRYRLYHYIKRTRIEGGWNIES